MNLNNEIGKILREVREEQKISITSLATKVNITSNDLNKYENGLSKIPIETLEDMCNILNVNLINVLRKAKLNTKYVIGDKSYLGNKENVIKYLEENKEYDLLRLYNEIDSENNLIMMLDNNNQLNTEEVHQLLEIIKDFNNDIKND